MLLLIKHFFARISSNVIEDGVTICSFGTCQLAFVRIARCTRYNWVIMQHYRYSDSHLGCPLHYYYPIFCLNINALVIKHQPSLLSLVLYILFDNSVISNAIIICFSCSLRCEIQRDESERQWTLLRIQSSGPPSVSLTLVISVFSCLCKLVVQFCLRVFFVGC